MPIPNASFRFAEARKRWTVTTLSCIEAGIRLRRTADLHAGDGLSADLTGAGWPERTANWTPITEAEAGQRLVRMADAHTFTLYEYYRTDKAGHSQDMPRAGRVLGALDRFLAGILDAFDPARHLLLVTSDHGNIEDLSTKSHTRNPVPFIALGRRADAFAKVETLTDVTPAIMRAVVP